MRWMLEAWDAAHSARRGGVDVRAVTAWALLRPRRLGQSRHAPRRSLRAWGVRCARTAPAAHRTRHATERSGIRTLACATGPRFAWLVAPAGPALGCPACRPVSPWVSPAPSSMRDRARVGHRPILITGGGGTLATAFARICAARGLGYEVLSRAAAGHRRRGAVAAALERVRPWAIVNAAGYARVDDAESDESRCRRENTTGAQLLAEACGGRRLRLICFSSDLVFDGQSRRPYRESDRVGAALGLRPQQGRRGGGGASGVR